MLDSKVIPLTPKTEYDVHCVSEDDNVYPQVTNLYQRPAVRMLPRVFLSFVWLASFSCDFV